MFFPFLGLSAIALGLVKLGALSVWLVVLQSMLAVAVAVALPLGLGHVCRRHKASSPKD